MIALAGLLSSVLSILGSGSLRQDRVRLRWLEVNLIDDQHNIFGLTHDFLFISIGLTSA